MFGRCDPSFERGGGSWGTSSWGSRRRWEFGLAANSLGDSGQVLDSRGPQFPLCEKSVLCKLSYTVGNAVSGQRGRGRMTWFGADLVPNPFSAWPCCVTLVKLPNNVSELSPPLCLYNEDQSHQEIIVRTT